MPRTRHTEDEYSRPDLLAARYRLKRSAFFEAELSTTDAQTSSNNNATSQLNETLAPTIIRRFHPPPPDEEE